VSKLSAFIGMLLLVGCAAEPVVVRTQQVVVVMPADNLFVCNRVEIPPTSNITDIQVAAFIANLYQQNRQCKNSLDAIRTFLEDAKKSMVTN
jgi:uncharacterized protein YcfL